MIWWKADDGSRVGGVRGGLAVSVPVFGPDTGEAEPRPMIMLDWSLWCARHLEPYRERWPRGTPLAMARLFDAAVAMPAVADAAKGDASNLTAALQRFRPLCCFIGKEALDRIYAETLPAEGSPVADR